MRAAVVMDLTSAPRLAPTTITVLADLLLLVKLAAFIPSNLWLIIYGPRLSQRIRALEGLKADLRVDARVLDQYVRIIENNGASERVIGSMRCEPIRALRFVRPSRTDKFKNAHPAVYRTTNVLAATPAVTVIATSIGFFTASGSALFSVVTMVALLAALAAATLATAPITRMTLGVYDVHTAGLQPYMRVFRRWRVLDDSNSSRDGLTIYFLTLFLLSTYLYAFCYNLLHIVQIQLPSFHAFMINSGASPNIVTWLYFSVVTVATVGYGDIAPINHWAQLVVLTQVLSGPFLLTWLLAIALGERSRS